MTSLEGIKDSYRKRLYFRILLAFVFMAVSCLYGSQHVFLLHDIDWDIRNATFFTVFQAWDAEHYIAQIREIVEGNYLLSNTYLAEYKNTQISPWPLFPFYLCALAAKILHLDVWQLAVLMDFVLPPLIFLIAYFFLNTLTSDRLIPMLGSFTLTVLPHLGRVEIVPLILFRFLEHGFAVPILKEAHQSYDGCFARTINPQLTYLFLLCSLLWFAKFLRTSQKRYGILSAFFGIILSYSYVYFSTYLYACLGLILILSFLFREKNIFIKTSCILFIILVAALPFWYKTFRFSSSHLNQMAWMVNSREPIFSFVAGYFHVAYQIILTGILCIGIVILILKKWIDTLTGFFAFALIAGGIICLNQHILTGIRVQENHYMKYVIPQATVLVIFLLFSSILKTSPWRSVPHTAFLLYGGGFLVIISVIMTPNFAATHFSPDGQLTPGIYNGIEFFHRVGMIIGGCCCLLGIGLKKYTYRLRHFYNALTRSRFQIFIKTLPVGLTLIIISLVLRDVGFGRYEQYQTQLKPELGYIQEIAPAFQWLNTHTEQGSVVLGSVDLLSTSSMIPIYTHNNVYAAYHAQFYAIPPLSEFWERVYTIMAFMGIHSQKQLEEFKEQTVWMKVYQTNYQEYEEILRKDTYTALKNFRIDYLFYGPREKKNFRIDPEQTYSFLQQVYNDGAVKIYQIL